MAEEEKKVTETATEEKKEPKMVYGYTVKFYDNGLYDLEGLTLEGADKPSIDQYHIALDLVELGRKLDHQLTVEEAEQKAVQRVMATLQKMAMDQAAATEEAADPTKA